MKEIIVLFKTHLDIGFTDFAKNVTDNYITTFIPGAVKTAAEVRKRGERFIWTTGSWLIYEYLRRCPDDKEFINAVELGDIRWHALPFTSHTELMDGGLLDYALGLSKKLDERFGVTTRGAKMTDVTGHTRAMIPHAAKAGMRFLHIGTNSACPMPEVPKIFRWVNASGDDMLVLYQTDYGQFEELGDSGVAICFAHTADNHGPQGADSIIELYAKLREEHPGAYVHAGTLEDVAAVVESMENLPVVTKEIGDTWIHGTGSDPLKISRYRALLRLCAHLPKEEADEIYDRIMLVPEHTWGWDEKEALGKFLIGEHRYFVRTEFEQMRRTEKFKLLEDSWAEQRGYVDDALQYLRGIYPEAADAIMAETTAVPVSAEGYREAGVNEPVQVGGYTVTVDEHGALCALQKDGTVFADGGHLLGDMMYQAFSKQDYDTFHERYVTVRHGWALEDLGKFGCEAAISERLTCRPVAEKAWVNGNSLICEARFTGPSYELYGAPGRVTMIWSFLPDEVRLDARWFDKPASRVGEAIWMGMHPVGTVAAIKKIDEWINPVDGAPRGNRRLHAVNLNRAVRMDNGCEIESVDSALVNIGEPDVLGFHTDDPSTDNGVFFNLFNNIYGTNFVMWYDEDARFRFSLHLK